MTSSLSPVYTDFSAHSDCMLITFGSLRLRAEVPPFEWSAIAAPVPAKKLLTRELNQAWYLQGMPGIADSADEIADYFRMVIREQDCTRVVTLGSSMGGFAALLFGRLLPADVAIAMGPQTFLPTRYPQLLTRAFLRKKWRILWRYWQIIGNRRVNRSYFDLRPLLTESGGQTTYHLYYSNNKKDRIQAQHLAGLPNVHLHEKTSGGHLVVHTMRDSGELHQVILQAVQPEGEDEDQ